MNIDPQFVARIDLRTRLRSLCVLESSCFATEQRNCGPVYSESELAAEPIKWLKYLLLDRTGVESIDKIGTQIHRFALQAIDEAQAWACGRLDVANHGDRQPMVVAKLVPWDQGAQLKNYRMLSTVDVSGAFREIRLDVVSGAHELWCCESEIGTSGFNLGGRLNYPRCGGAQVMELVWFASPRLVENVRLGGFEFPYLRAERVLGNPEFAVTCLHLPERFDTVRRQDPWLDDFAEVLLLLGSRSSAMDRLVSMLHAFGANEVCFCFKITDGDLTVIDWDTEIESAEVARPTGGP